jgi:hypothetical protein
VEPTGPSETNSYHESDLSSFCESKYQPIQLHETSTAVFVKQRL